MNRGSSPNGFSGLSSLRTAVQTRRRMPEREFHISFFPHTKGRRRGSCVIPSASITSKSHDNTINPHFPSLLLMASAMCSPAGRHVPSRRLPFAAPPVANCRPGGCHLVPRRLSFAAPPVAIWRLPSAANPNRMNHSSRNRD